MYVTARSYLATGVAVVGATAIAISPVSPVHTQLAEITVPTISVPTISSAAVELTSLANPLELWVQVLTGAIDNVGGLGQDWLSDPAPALRQFITNQIGYLETLTAAGSGVVTGLTDYLSPSNPYGFTATLETAFDQFALGDIAQGVSSLITAFITAPIVGAIGIPLLGSGLLDIPVQMAQNATDAITALLSLNTALPLLLGALGPVLGPLNALGTTGQEIFDSLSTGDLVSALTAVVNIPATLTDAVLNGFTAFDGTFSPGLLSYSNDGFSGGVLQAVLLTIPRAIAAALGAAPPAQVAAATADVAQVSTPVTEASTTVTLDVTNPQDAAATPAAAGSDDAAPEPGGTDVPAPVIEETTAPETTAPDDEVPAEEVPAEEAPTEEVTEEATEEESTDGASDEDAAEEGGTAEETPADQDSGDTDSAGTDSQDGDTSGTDTSSSDTSSSDSSDSSSSSDSGTAAA